MPLRLLPAVMLAALLAAPATAAPRSLSVTVSPQAFVIPMVHLTAELRLQDELAVAVSGGAAMAEGSVLLQLGVQGRWFLWGDFHHGAYAGAQAMLISGLDLSSPPLLMGTVQGGYKIVFDFGLTLGARLGLGAVTTRDDFGIAPLVGIDLGWTL